ncbi:hypothetical protein Mapa_008617 [Marchantia paleacea]|nr:hypothetical protein Mapa_008617 [Marchantia paleacea]
MTWYYHLKLLHPHYRRKQTQRLCQPAVLEVKFSGRATCYSSTRQEKETCYRLP